MIDGISSWVVDTEKTTDSIGNRIWVIRIIYKVNGMVYEYGSRKVFRRHGFFKRRLDYEKLEKATLELEVEFLRASKNRRNLRYNSKRINR